MPFFWPDSRYLICLQYVLEIDSNHLSESEPDNQPCRHNNSNIDQSLSVSADHVCLELLRYKVMETVSFKAHKFVISLKNCIVAARKEVLQ